MSDDSERRRLRRQINRFGNAPERKPPASPQAYILAGLNVLQALEETAQQYVADVLWYGPGAFAGEGWASAVIWMREKGYHTYRELTVFGVWAVSGDDAESILMGTRRLSYSAAIYNAESYQRLIQRDFTTYYGAAPPPSEDDILYRAAWAVERRLALRQQIRDEITHHLRLMRR